MLYKKQAKTRTEQDPYLWRSYFFKVRAKNSYLLLQKISVDLQNFCW